MSNAKAVAARARTITFPTPTPRVKDDRVTPIIENHVDRLNAAAEDIENQAQRLHALADRLLGQECGAEGKVGEPIPSPSHVIGRLDDAHQRLMFARNSLTLAVNRLETL